MGHAGVEQHGDAAEGIALLQETLQSAFPVFLKKQLQRPVHQDVQIVHPGLHLNE